MYFVHAVYVCLAGVAGPSLFFGWVIYSAQAEHERASSLFFTWCNYCTCPQSFSLGPEL